MKRILILYAKYGGGHLSAAKSIQTYIEENYLDANVKFVDCVEYSNPFLSSITTNAYKQMAIHLPSLWKKVYYDSDHGFLLKVSERTKKYMASKLLNLLNEFLPDVVISTHPFGSQIISYLKAHNRADCKLATILTDFEQHSQWLIGHEYCDFYFVSNNKMKEDLIKFNISSEKIHITGIPLSKRFYMPLQNSRIYEENSLHKDKKTILFFGGGELGLGKSRTIKILRTLVKYLGEYQIIAISGRNNKMNKEFLKLYDEIQNTDLHIYRYTTQVPELMSISSLVVSKPGGLTSSESIASHVPLLIINPIPGQEEQNAKFLESAGVGVWLKKEDDIKQVVHSLLSSPEKLDEMKGNCKKVAKINSTEEICEVIINGTFGNLI